jgi:hypothetical protein
MNKILAFLTFLAVGSPLAAQEEFREFITLAGRVGSGRSVEKETEHFIISAPSEAAAVLAPHVEKVWAFLVETLGVEPKEKLKLEFYFIGRSARELGGAFEKYDAENDTLHFQFDYDWRRDLARGIVGAYLHKLAPERAASIPPPLFHGLKFYLGNFDGRHDSAAFHVPMKGHLHVAKRAQSWAKGGKLTGGKKFADLKTAELAMEQEPGTWALAGYLLNAKGKREELKAWLAAHVEGKEAPPFAAPETEVTRWASSLDVKLADRKEGRYLVSDTMYYTIYVQEGTQRIKPAMNDRQILEDLKKRMDLIYVKYAQGFKVDRFISRRPKLYYYKDRNSFVGAGGPPTALAFYMSLAKTLVGYENPDDKILTTFHVLAHEGCHQFFDLAFPGFYNSDEMPSWFSEGLADCFGSCEIRGGELMIFTTTGSAADYAEGVRFLAKEGRMTPLKELLTMSHQEFMRGAQVHYPQSWSICHFLWNTGYKEVLVRLIEGFKRGKPRDEVYAEAFVKDGRKIDLDALEREWLEYAKRILK